MFGSGLSEQLVSKALGYFRDPEYRTDLTEPVHERAGIAALKAGLELHVSFESLRETGFDPYEVGKVVLKLANDIRGE